MYSSFHGVFLGFLCFSCTHNTKFQTNKAGNRACPIGEIKTIAPPTIQANAISPLK